MSPKQVKITPGSCASAMPSSTRPIGITHTGQPGPCTSSTFDGQQIVEAVLVDRVRVPAADLHDLVVPRGVDGGKNLPGDGSPELGVPELVDELHAAPFGATKRGAGMHQQNLADEHRRDQGNLHGRAHALQIRAESQAPPPSILMTRMGTARRRR